MGYALYRFPTWGGEEAVMLMGMPDRGRVDAHFHLTRPSNMLEADPDALAKSGKPLTILLQQMFKSEGSKRCRNNTSHRPPMLVGSLAKAIT